MPELSLKRITVLLVEGDPKGLAQLERAFATSETENVDVEWVQRLDEALERVSRGRIDVVLLDLRLPDSNGIATFDRMNAFAPDVPIVVLTDLDDENVAIQTVQNGAQDYLVKSKVTPAVLVRSIRYAMERHRLLSALRSLSLIDDLTGLYNRRGFAELGEQHLRLAHRTDRAVTLVYVDLDGFKTINDQYGHQVGDRALTRVSDILKAVFRRSDILARMGGDEFAVLALEVSGDDASALVQRLRDRVAEFNALENEPFHLSMSLGVARYDPGDDSGLEKLLIAADRAMYSQKKKRSSSFPP